MAKKMMVGLHFRWWLFATLASATSTTEKAEQLNVLLVIVDDLRPVLGCYGDQRAHTPHLDRLASQSVLFERAYAQQALCAPSRNSILTSRRPSTLRLYDVSSYWRDAVGNFTTMPQHFKNHGYKTASFGKIFHPGASSNNSDDSPYSWTEPPFHPQTDLYKNAPLCPGNDAAGKLGSNLVCPVRVASMPNATLPDMETLQAAKDFMRREALAQNRAFFLAVGFQKPHIPLKYPKRYLKYHPMSKFKVPSKYRWPSKLNPVAYNPWMDLRRRDDVRKLGLTCPWQKIPSSYARKIIQSYYAAVTYVDELVGELLSELEQLGLGQRTLVAVTSDHGWSLGEHAEWAKYSLFEVSLRVPLLLSAPGLKAARIHQPVELLDLFPTLAELAGLPVESCPVGGRQPILCTEGSSLLGRIDAGRSDGWEERAAASLCPRLGPEPECTPGADEPRLRDIRLMGYSVRSLEFRYSVWFPFSWRDNRPNVSVLVAEELYDHNVDPGENDNVASSADYRLQKQRLRGILMRSLA